MSSVALSPDIFLPQGDHLRSAFSPTELIWGFPRKRILHNSVVGDEIVELLTAVEAKETSAITFSFNKQLNCLLESLQAIQHEFCVPDWNGEGALPIHPLSLEYAEHFLHRLHAENCTLPVELTPEPTGYLVMEWIRDDFHLALSINPEKRIEWAFLGPDVRSFGDAEYNENKKIPRMVMGLLDFTI